VPEEIIEETQVKKESSSVDLAGRILLLETKVLMLESKFRVLEEETVKVKFESKVKPQPTIYGANRKLKSFK
jgi:hypothetical protein